MGDGLGVAAGSGETEDSGDAVGSGVSVGFGDAVGSGEAVGVGSAEGPGEATGVGSAVGTGETGAVGVGEGHGRAARAGDGMRVSSINSAAIIDIAVLFIWFSSKGFNFFFSVLKRSYFLGTDSQSFKNLSIPISVRGCFAI